MVRISNVRNGVDCVRVKKSSKQSGNSSVTIGNGISDSSDSNVSVITKTMTPQVVIQSEKVDKCYDSLFLRMQRNKVLWVACLIMMCMIVLATFFLSLKTYNMMNELILAQ